MPGRAAFKANALRSQSVNAVGTAPLVKINAWVGIGVHPLAQFFAFMGAGSTTLFWYALIQLCASNRMYKYAKYTGKFRDPRMPKRLFRRHGFGVRRNTTRGKFWKVSAPRALAADGNGCWSTVAVKTKWTKMEAGTAACKWNYWNLWIHELGARSLRFGNVAKQNCMFNYDNESVACCMCATYTSKPHVLAGCGDQCDVCRRKAKKKFQNARNLKAAATPEFDTARCVEPLDKLLLREERSGLDAPCQTETIFFWGSEENPSS